MKIDLHVHTNLSRCGTTSIGRLKSECDKRGIIPAITDHNTIKGALEYRKECGKCIIGEEILTREGEIIGLFLKKEIPAKLSLDKTISLIRKQGGLVMLPHPFDRMRTSRLDDESIERVKDMIDIVEVYNSRTIFPSDNKKAQRFARKNGKAASAGSDSHFWFTPGKSHVEIKPFTKNTFLKELEKGSLVMRRSPLLVHAISKILKTYRNYVKR